MKKLIKNGIITSPDALEFLVEHLVDMLLYHEKLQLINYIYSFDMFEENTFEYYIKKYLDKKIIKTARLTSMILFFIVASIFLFYFFFKNKLKFY